MAPCDGNPHTCRALGPKRDLRREREIAAIEAAILTVKTTFLVLTAASIAGVIANTWTAMWVAIAVIMGPFLLVGALVQGRNEYQRRRPPTPLTPAEHYDQLLAEARALLPQGVPLDGHARLLEFYGNLAGREPYPSLEDPKAVAEREKTAQTEKARKTFFGEEAQALLKAMTVRRPHGPWVKTTFGTVYCGSCRIRREQADRHECAGIPRT